jgi:hypothetical protein
MIDPEAFRRFHLALEAAEWTEGEIDGDRILMCDRGGVCLTIWYDYPTIEWSVVIIPMDDVVGNGHFVERGEAKTLQEAKDTCLEVPRLRAMLRKTFAYILGEIDLDTGSSTTPVRPA